MHRAFLMWKSAYVYDVHWQILGKYNLVMERLKRMTSLKVFWEKSKNGSRFVVGYWSHIMLPNAYFLLTFL